MLIVWGLIWGALTLAVMLLSIKYYLPYLSARKKTSAPEASAASGGSAESEAAGGHQSENHENADGADEKDEKDNVPAVLPEKETSAAPGINKNRSVSSVLRRRVLTFLIPAICACFAFWCGYTASGHSTSIFNLLKMTLTAVVLSCVLVTDAKLNLIPNPCPLVLLGGRLVILVFEFIRTGKIALIGLADSGIAMLLGFLILLIASKLSHGGVGMGDIKLYAALGFMLGVSPVCFVLLFGFFLCALVSTVLLILKKKQLKDSLPMGPFIWAGYGLAVLLTII